MDKKVYSQLLEPAERVRLLRGRRKIKRFIKMTEMQYKDIEARTDIKPNETRCILHQETITATVQERMDAFVERFHLNPEWAYGDSSQMMLDTKILTQAELILINIDTKEKKNNFIKRFYESCQTDGVSNRKLGKMAMKSHVTINAWFSRKIVTKDVVNAVIKYCENYNVRIEWILTGEGPRIDDRERPKPKPKPKPKAVDWWYVVNYTEVRPDEWVCIPERYTIKRAKKAIEVMKDYPSERVWCDGVPDVIIRTERAIGRYKTKESAERALKREKERIMRDGPDVLLAPWPYEEVR